jgi:hypothetical protein
MRRLFAQHARSVDRRWPFSRHVHPGFRRGHALTDRDHVDDVPGPASASAASILLLEKTRIAVPSPAATGLPRAWCMLPLAAFSSGPRSDIATAAIRQGHSRRSRSCRNRCDAAAGHESAESCRRPEILGRSVAASEGTASRFFAEEDTGPMGRESAKAQIHLIAICKSRPRLDGRVSTTRPPLRRGTGLIRLPPALHRRSRRRGIGAPPGTPNPLPKRPVRCRNQSTNDCRANA